MNSSIPESHSVPQCEQCFSALTDGYCEMTLALTDERKRLCWSCALDEMVVKRALELDDVLRSGALERC